MEKLTKEILDELFDKFNKEYGEENNLDDCRLVFAYDDLLYGWSDEDRSKFVEITGLETDFKPLDSGFNEDMRWGVFRLNEIYVKFVYVFSNDANERSVNFLIVKAYPTTVLEWR